MRNKKRIIWIIILLLLIIFGAIFGIRAYKNAKAQRTETEWFERQQVYLDNLETYANNMDKIYSLYIAQSISESDFLTHVDSLEKQLKLIEYSYNRELKEHPVKVHSGSYHAQKGIEAVEGCFQTFENILTMTKKNYQDPNALAYKYMAYQQDIARYLSTYTAAKLLEDGTQAQSSTQRPSTTAPSTTIGVTEF